MLSPEQLVHAIKIVEGIDDQGQDVWLVGIEFDDEHGIFDKCNDKGHAEMVCRQLQEAARRFASAE